MNNAAPDARYDAVADWYLNWVTTTDGVVSDPDFGLLPPELGGQRWLDVACGTGRTSRELAHRGAEVVGIDLSAEMTARAKTVSDPLSQGTIQYVSADVTQPECWWDGRLFDGAVCDMAIMDIDDLAGTLVAVAQVLRPHGRFLASLVHPCFPGSEAGLSSWPPEKGSLSEGWWTSPNHNPDGVRIRVGSNHRTLSSVLNALIDVGLCLECVIEPSAPVPTLLVVSCRRIGGNSIEDCP